MTAPSRPVLRWHGGKWRLAPWIISHFPPHRIYVEPFGGAASVLLRKQRSYAEVYNDLDDEVVNLFRVLRDDPQSNGYTLIDFLIHTPFARTEFEEAYEETTDPVERARRLIVRSFMGFGSNGHNAAVKTGFRSASSRSGTTPAHDWGNYPDVLETIIKRVRGVVIENRDAVAVMRQHDDPMALHYVDPPYLPQTRSDKSRKGGGQVSRLPARTDRRPAPGSAVCLAFIVRHGGSLRVPPSPVRRCPAGVASRRDGGPGRWRAPAHRSALAQSGMRRGPFPSSCRRLCSAVLPCGD